MIKPILILSMSLFAAAVLAEPTRGQDFSGVWKGKWFADATERRGEHGGALRVRLTKTGENTYQGRFSGRFAVVIPYFYRSTVTQSGSHLYATKKLGPMGEYSMALSGSCNGMCGRWKTGGHSGRIQLARRK